ncbi:MAG: hypothetical protein LBL36_03395 [Clostridiales Family XIII bacterium]|nr:hypothetical protein [Clostridiales Family XIII bacterium]
MKTVHIASVNGEFSAIIGGMMVSRRVRSAGGIAAGAWGCSEINETALLLKF